jgi:hypothetical protein
MSATQNITFISDTPPLKSKGSGISVLLYNMLTALAGSYNLSVLTFCIETKVTPKEIIEDNPANHVLVFDSRFLKIYKMVRFGILKKIVQFISFLCFIPHLIRKYNNDQNVFITVVGASIAPVYKAWLLMKFVPRSKHCLYIVDDLELINRKYKNRFELFLISMFLKRTIQQTDLLISISKGLKDLYLTKYNKDSLILFPHFKRVMPLVSKQIQNNNEFVFLFTGGLNLLYNESLKFFASVIEQMNKQNDQHLIFKLIIQTYSDYKDFEALNFNENYVFFSTSDNRDELLNVYEKCNCFLIPYSFAEADKGMVVTSFPQKIAEIIQYGKQILVFGPDYSSVNSFFYSNHLDFICDKLDYDDLKTVISKAVNFESNFTAYEDVYNKSLSSVAVTRVFEEIIKQVN